MPLNRPASKKFPSEITAAIIDRLIGGDGTEDLVFYDMSDLNSRYPMMTGVLH
ncbi:MAG: hypothetical protein WKF77_06385 [Planctomycetaceae bacterium]